MPQDSGFNSAGAFQSSRPVLISVGRGVGLLSFPFEFQQILNQLSLLEYYKLNPGLETLQMCEQEIGNVAPESYIEDGIYTRLCTQFSWGSRYNVPFKHSSDTTSAVAATLGKFAQ